MAFRALHKQWGEVFAHLPDLGCEQNWEAVWKVKPPPPLSCDECGHRMYAKVASTGLRFFAHARDAPTCAGAARESMAHHLLKLELAHAARDAGGHAELEVRSPSGAWRTDVLATSPGGAKLFALEAQLAPITAADIAARTDRMRVDGIACCWFTDQPRPWLGTVPSVRLALPDGAGLVVVEGLMRFTTDGWDAVSVPLRRFLEWMFTGRVIPHSPRLPLRPMAVVWTALSYVQAEEDYLAEAKRRHRREKAHAEALQRAYERQRALIKQKMAVPRRMALRRAAQAEVAARGNAVAARAREQVVCRPEVARAITLLRDEYGIEVTVGWSAGASRYAGGVPLLDEEGNVAAVIDPRPQHLGYEAFLVLAEVLLLFATYEQQQTFEFAASRRKITPPGGYRSNFLHGRPCVCADSQLVVRIAGIEYPAERSPDPDPDAASYRARCLACGRRFEQPWRRVRAPV